MAIYLLLAIVIILTLAISLAVKMPKAMKERRKRLEAEASGNFIKRKSNFYKDKEFLKAYIQYPDAFFNSLTAAVQNTGVCTISGNYNSRVFYQGVNHSWTAVLDRLQSNDGSMVYSF